MSVEVGLHNFLALLPSILQSVEDSAGNNGAVTQLAVQELTREISRLRTNNAVRKIEILVKNRNLLAEIEILVKNRNCS